MLPLPVGTTGTDTLRRSCDDTVFGLGVPPVVPFNRTLCPASPSLQWVPWVSVPHLAGLGIHCNHGPRCRVGGGRANALPLSAQSNGPYGFPISRFPLLLLLRSHCLLRLGIRWVSRTKPYSPISRLVGYLRHITLRQRLAKNE